jgi:hypothetical protein
MRQCLFSAARASVIALGALGFASGVATADNNHTILIPPIPSTTTTGTGISGEKTGTGHKIFLPGTATTGTGTSNLFAPLWVYPSMPSVAPVMVAPPPVSGPGVIVIREEPSLLRPADLHFSVATEHGVTVVRGPLAQ